MTDCQQITIIGTGLLGASLGLALKRSGFSGRVLGLGRHRGTLDEAVAVGAIDAGVTDYAQAIPGSDLVVVCVPLSGFLEVFERIAPHDHAGLVVTDVGSTKVSVHAAARAALPRPDRFVGAHPMAGSERQGPGAARADLFEGKRCIITTDDLATAAGAEGTHAGGAGGGTEGGTVARVEALWRSVGMSLLRLGAAEHDRQTAAVSHLPHVAAVGLVRAAEQLGGWGVAATGFRDTTRLASSNPPMRADIMEANRDALLEAINAYAGQLDRLRAAVAGHDHAGLRAMLEESKQARDRWIGD